LVITISGKILSISWAITPISCPSNPCSCFNSSFQSNSYPDICFILSKGLEILTKFSLSLLSEVEKATTSFCASILPTTAEGLIFPTAIEVVTLRLDVSIWNVVPSSDAFEFPMVEALVNLTTLLFVPDTLIEVPEVPDVPDTPEDPDVPVSPEVPDVPVNPEEPDVPVNPDVPEDPEEPVDPEEPDVPEDPVSPEVPEDPEEPDVPEDPVRPEVPEDPVKPDEPEVPDDPVRPEDPDVPEEPEAPLDPFIPLAPASPDMANSTIISSLLLGEPVLTLITSQVKLP